MPNNRYTEHYTRRQMGRGCSVYKQAQSGDGDASGATYRKNNKRQRAPPITCFRTEYCSQLQKRIMSKLGILSLAYFFSNNMKTCSMSLDSGCSIRTMESITHHDHANEEQLLFNEWYNCSGTIRKISFL